jgi:hypothetical protein
MFGLKSLRSSLKKLVAHYKPNGKSAKSVSKKPVAKTTKRSVQRDAPIPRKISKTTRKPKRS